MDMISFTAPSHSIRLFLTVKAKSSRSSGINLLLESILQMMTHRFIRHQMIWRDNHTFFTAKCSSICIFSYIIGPEHSTPKLVQRNKKLKKHCSKRLWGIQHALVKPINADAQKLYKHSFISQSNNQSSVRSKTSTPLLLQLAIFFSPCTLTPPATSSVKSSSASTNFHAPSRLSLS